MTAQNDKYQKAITKSRDDEYPLPSCNLHRVDLLLKMCEPFSGHLHYFSLKGTLRTCADSPAV